MIPVFDTGCDKEPCDDPLAITGEMSKLVLYVLNYAFDDLELLQKTISETNQTAITAVNKYVNFLTTKVVNNVTNVVDYLGTYTENLLTEQQVLLNQVAPGLFAEAMAAQNQQEETKAISDDGTPVAVKDSVTGESGVATIPIAAYIDGESQGIKSGGKDDNGVVGNGQIPSGGNAAAQDGTKPQGSNGQDTGVSFQTSPTGQQFQTEAQPQQPATQVGPLAAGGVALVGGGGGGTAANQIVGECKPTGQLVWALVQVYLVSPGQQQPPEMPEQPEYAPVEADWPGTQGDDDESWYGE